MKKIISTDNAPAAIGPYSQAVRYGEIIYISGQLPINPSTGSFSGNDISSQTKQCLENLKAIVDEVGCDMSSILKTTVLLDDLSNFAIMNEVYETYFDFEFPARAAYQVAKLPKGALIEIEAIAAIGERNNGRNIIK